MEPHHEKGVEGHQCYFFLTDVLSQVHFFFWEEICLRKLKVHKTCTGILEGFTGFVKSPPLCFFFSAGHIR